MIPRMKNLPTTLRGLFQRAVNTAQSPSMVGRNPRTANLEREALRYVEWELKKMIKESGGWKDRDAASLMALEEKFRSTPREYSKYRPDFVRDDTWIEKIPEAATKTFAALRSLLEKTDFSLEMAA